MLSLLKVELKRVWFWLLLFDTRPITFNSTNQHAAVSLLERQKYVFDDWFEGELERLPIGYQLVNEVKLLPACSLAYQFGSWLDPISHSMLGDVLLDVDLRTMFWFCKQVLYCVRFRHLHWNFFSLSRFICCPKVCDLKCFVQLHTLSPAKSSCNSSSHCVLGWVCQ